MNYKKILFGGLLAAALVVPFIKSYSFIGIGIGPFGIGAGYNPGYYNGYYYDGYYYPRDYYYYPRHHYYSYPGYYYGNPRYYYQHPVEETYYPQQAMTMPSDIQEMQSYVSNAMNTVMTTDIEMISDVKKQKDLMQHEGVVMRLGNRFNKEYQMYLNMFRSNNPNLSAQADKLRNAYNSFKMQYENFMNEVK